MQFREREDETFNDNIES